MQNSEYLALPIVCQRICSDVLWHFTTVQSEPETARSRLWSSRHACFHLHVTTSTWRVLLFSFLGLFGLLYPLSACIPAETQSHVQASTWESGLVRPNQPPWSQLTLVPAVPQSLWRGQPSPHNVCCQEAWGSQHLLYWTLHKASVCQSWSWGVSVLPCPIFQVLYMRPIAAGLQLIPGHAGKAHCSA